MTETAGSPPPGGTEGWKHRWPRRRILLWATALVPATMFGGWNAYDWLQAREKGAWFEQQSAALTRDAFELAFAGRLKDANAKAHLALEYTKTYAQAWLLKACIYLEEGKWEEARVALSPPSLRDTPEANLLRELLERRPKAPDWRQAFLDAWQASGKPDFRKSTLLPPPLAEGLLLTPPPSVWEQADETQRLLLAVLDMTLLETHAEWALEQLRASQSVPLLMALREQLSYSETRASLRQAFLPPVQERLMQLAGPSPRTLQLALFPLFASNPSNAPFERRELEALEALLKLPDWKQTSNEQLFLELRERLRGLMLVPGHHAWLLTLWSQGLFLGIWLLERALASKARLTEDELRWMGRLFHELGARLCEQRSDRELTMGLRMQIHGSEQTGHGPTRMQALARWVELGRWEEAVERAGVYRWPLASLQEEACEMKARDEQSWMRTFAG